jgi:hypothetical protein
MESIGQVVVNVRHFCMRLLVYHALAGRALGREQGSRPCTRELTVCYASAKSLFDAEMLLDPVKPAEHFVLLDIV